MMLGISGWPGPLAGARDPLPVDVLPCSSGDPLQLSPGLQEALSP
jgi:hypothetical protein